jgi:protein-disulfide isomerase
MSQTLSKREMLREKRKQQKRRNTITFITVSVIGILLIAALIVLPKLLTKTTKYENTDKFSIGDPNAPITVVEFSNYGCSHCKDFSENTEADFIETYVKTGEVYFTYVNIPYNDASYIAAAEASYCAAEQNMFYEYKEQLFTYVGYTDSYSIDNLNKYASTVGMDTTAFAACMESDAYAQSYLDDYAYADSIGLQGTPSFLINGTELVYASQLYDSLNALLQN